MVIRALCASIVLALATTTLWPAAGQSAAGVPRDPRALGYLDLKKRHPSGAEGAADFEGTFTTEQALLRLEQMRGFLASFKGLTGKARGRVSRSELEAVGNTSAEMQSIGFNNLPLIVEGTLLKQAYQLAQARYELAQLRHAQRQATDEDLARARSAYAEATRRFQAFWDTRLPTD
jgi:hypothetical protein